MTNEDKDFVMVVAKGFMALLWDLLVTISAVFVLLVAIAQTQIPYCQ
jgi:hypothetical protein